MDSQLCNLLSRDMKNKIKTKINQQTIIKNSRKIKNHIKIKGMENVTPNMDRYHRNRWEIPILNLIRHVNPGNK